jgi:transposase-like protein
MPKGQVIVIEYQNQPMSLREFADAVGVAHKTVQRRWTRGTRSVEQLGRPADMRFSHPQLKAKICINSLLAGWRLQS